MPSLSMVPITESSTPSTACKELPATASIAMAVDEFIVSASARTSEKSYQVHAARPATMMAEARASPIVDSVLVGSRT